MPAMGLDISDEAVKFVGLHSSSKGTRLGKYGKVALEKDIISGGTIHDEAKLIEILGQLKKENGMDFVHASLPDEHAYLFQTDVPRELDYYQIKTVIESKLKENVPLGPEEVIFDYIAVPHTATKEERLVAVAVYPREIATAYARAIQAAGINVLSFETEGEANTRAIVKKGEQETIMVVDIGKLGTELSIIHNGIVAFSTSLEVSGDDFTSSIAKYLAISFDEAEKVKADRGFVKSEENIDLFEALLGVVSVLRDDINKHLAYWQMHSGVRKALQHDVEKIVLCGGGSNLKGLQEYLTVTMDIPIEHANVWVNVTGFDDYVPNMPQGKSLAFTTPIGLALRSVMRGA